MHMMHMMRMMHMMHMQAANADRPLSESRMRRTKDFQPRYGMPAAMVAAKAYVKLAERCMCMCMCMPAAMCVHGACEVIWYDIMRGELV